MEIPICFLDLLIFKNEMLKKCDFYESSNVQVPLLPLQYLKQLESQAAAAAILCH